MSRWSWGHAGAAFVAVSTFAPWPSVGRARGSGFDFASRLGQLAHVLDLDDVRWIAVSWYLVPASVALTLLGVGAQHRRVWWLVSFIDLLAVGVAVATIWAAHRVGLEGPYVGPLLAAGGALVGAAAAVVAALHRSIVVERAPVQGTTCLEPVFVQEVAPLAGWRNRGTS